jgi:hypothetical protein
MRPGLNRRIAIVTAALILLGVAAGAPDSPLPAEAELLLSPRASAGTRLTTIPETSEVRYRLRAQVIAQPPEDVICITHAVTGDVVIGPEGTIVPDQSHFLVDQRTMQCNSARANSLVQRTLDTSTHPMTEFMIREAPGLPIPLPNWGDVAFQFVGDQKVRTTTRPLTFDVTATFTEQGMTGLAVARTRLTDYGLKPPGLGPLLRVDDNLTVEISFQAVAADAGL